MDMHTQLPIPVPEVIHQVLADGAVLFLPSEEIYFGLNEVGELVWSLLPPACSTLEELCARVSARYPEVERATVTQDVRELLDELVAQRLARVSRTDFEAADAPDTSGS
jgi:hypothetical protein